MARELTAEQKRKMHEGRERAAREQAARGRASWREYRSWMRHERELFLRLQAAREGRDRRAIELAAEAYTEHLKGLRIPSGPPPRR